MDYLARQIAGQLNYHGRKLKQNTQTSYQAKLADELIKQRRLVYQRGEKKYKRSFKSFSIL